MALSLVPIIEPKNVSLFLGHHPILLQLVIIQCPHTTQM